MKAIISKVMIQQITSEWKKTCNFYVKAIVFKCNKIETKSVCVYVTINI